MTSADTHAAADAADAVASIARLEREGRRYAVAFAGGQVVWRRYGDGPALVLLHGGHGGWQHWARNIRALATRHAVWLPDLPGYGDSDPPPANTLDALVGTTLATLDALIDRAAPIAIAGFSFGALVAAHLATRRGAVAQLALFGPGGHGGARRPRGTLQPWRDAAARHDAAALAAAMRRNLGLHMLHAAPGIDALALHIHTDACLRTRFRSADISRAGGLAAALDRHVGPLLLAWGEHDVTAVPAQAGAALGAGRADCRVQIVAGAGHWVQYETADAVNALLLGWLDESRAAPTG